MILNDCKRVFQTNISERNMPRVLNLIALANVKKACTALCKHKLVQENFTVTFNAQATPTHSCSRAQTYSHSTGNQVNIIKLKQTKKLASKKISDFQNC